MSPTSINQSEKPHGRPFVVLDRDGTIIVERNYLSSPDQVELIPGAADGLRMLRRLGMGLIIATNQSGIGRGYFSQSRLEEIHHRLTSLLRDAGVKIDAIYYCSHLPADNCDCRKPNTGMVERAVRELGLDPTASFMVGDNWSDIEMGRRIGATTVLVRTGHGSQVESDPLVQPDHVAAGLAEAALLIQQMVLRKEG